MPTPQPIPPRSVPRRRRFCSAALLLTLAVSGCSTDEETERSQPEAAPSPTPSSSPATPQSVEEMDGFCRRLAAGEPWGGYPGAPEHTGAGPHPTAVFTRTTSTNAHLASFHLRQDRPFRRWLPASPEEAVLLACVRPRSSGAERIDTCEYRDSSDSVVGSGPPLELPLHEQDYEFGVYAVSTGEQVATGEVAPAGPLCPEIIISDSPVREASMAYTPLDEEELYEAIEEVVSAPGP